MHISALLAAILPPLVMSAPLVERAGGPEAVPIPRACTIINPIPHAACGISNVDGYKPSPPFVKDNLLYSVYFTTGLSRAADAKQCQQQCYGYGYRGQCKSSFIAYYLPNPTTGALSTACLLFNEYLTPLNFVGTVQGHYMNATAANIYCPS